MSAFQEAQTALAALLQERGLVGAVWEWNALGWSPKAPNTGRRWLCHAGKWEGRGDTGQEALINLVEAMRGTDSK